MTRVALLTIGDELLDGRVIDANAAYAGRRLAERGTRLSEWRCVDDDIPAIAEAVRDLAARADLLVVSGGIGPTTDDLTRRALAEAAGVQVEVRPEVLERLRERYARRGREMPASNERQAEFPTGAAVLDSDVGTADACCIAVGGTDVVSLPGVPREFRALFDRWVLPRIEARDVTRWSIRLHGRGESGLADVVAPLTLPPGIASAWRATAPWVDVSLVGPPADVSRTARILGDALAPWRVPEGATNWSEALAVALQRHGLTIATAESCTGGAIAAAITAVPGASAWFPGGVVAYANEAKVAALGVPEDLLARQGAVSHGVAAQMARGARTALGADLGVGSTGIAGPTGGSDAKPVGTVFIACAREDVTAVAHCCFRGRERAAFVAAATQMALRLACAVVDDAADTLASCDDVVSVTVVPRTGA